VFPRADRRAAAAAWRSLTVLASVVARNPSQSDAVARIPRALAFRHDVLPLSMSRGTIVIGLSDVDAIDVLDAVRRATRLKVEPVPLTREHIRERLAELYAVEVPLQSAEERRTETPAVRAVSAMFAHAIAAHASDVHVEPQRDGGAIRLRVDGVLIPYESISADLYNAFVSRIKLLAGMDIADKRQPQDGRTSLPAEGRSIDARVSSMPTIDGEKLVIRLLDHHTQSCELTALGMPPDILAAYRRLVRAPWGFNVVTGPTGSGKTTTLYASLADLDTAKNNVCSVEDPIEMRVAGVTQVGVNPRAGVTFASALRGFMRQDPNVIMVGEMRDPETAAVAISASLAGQLVFTTLHSNDAPRTIERLVDLGVTRQSLAAGLSGVLAQRLARRLCESCRTAAPIPADLRLHLNIDADAWWTPGACGACAGTGYAGRVGVYELLEVTDDLRDAITAGASSVAIAQLAAASGYRPMFVDGLAKVESGDTSFAELTRVVTVAAR
jgi:type II secretory ATPase GspE/PulE/Tfp pilus assembly ATPase PilB-like protein